VPGGNDWSVQAADTIERVVGAIRDKTSVPLTTVARALVFGLLAAVMGLTTLVFLTIAAVRVVNIVLPGEVWTAYLLIGGIFTVAGLFVLRKATSAKTSRESRKP
jgi:uncharacterized membrane protein HdeD (DUF308 family)